MMQETILISLPVSQLQVLISDCVNACLDGRADDQSKDPAISDYLTISETCKRMGGISKVTLNQYTKTGRIKAYRIGGRVLYKPTDIEAAMTAVKTKSGGLKR